MPMLRLLVFMLVATVFLPARAAIECPDGFPVGGQVGVPPDLPALLGTVPSNPERELLLVQIAWLPVDEEQRYRFQEVIDIDWRNRSATQVYLYDGETGAVAQQNLREAELLGSTRFETGHLDVLFCMPSFRTRGLVFAHYGQGGEIQESFVVPFAWRLTDREETGLWFFATINPETSRLLDSFNDVTAREVTEDVERATGVVPRRYLAESLVQQNLKSFTDVVARDGAPFFAGTGTRVVGNQLIVTAGNASVSVVHGVGEVYSRGVPLLQGGDHLAALENHLGPISMESRGERRPAFIVDGRADFDANVSECVAGVSFVTVDLRFPSVLDGEITVRRTDLPQTEPIARGQERVEAEVSCDGTYQIDARRQLLLTERGTGSGDLVTDQARAVIDFGDPEPLRARLVYVFASSNPLEDGFPTATGPLAPDLVSALLDVEELTVENGGSFGCSAPGGAPVDSIDEIVANAYARLSPEQLALLRMDEDAFTDGDGDGSVCNAGEAGDGTDYRYIREITVSIVPNLGAGIR